MSTSGSGIRRAAARLAPALLVAALALPGLTSCEGDGGSDSSAPVTGAPTPLDKLDTRSLVVDRSSFCSSVAPDAVEAALDSADYQGDEYGNGDAAQITDEVKDVAHEYGCTWRTEDGRVARAWVFAPPVTPERAKRLRAGALRQGCSATKDGAAYGSISVATTCAGKDAAVQGYFGLFGDAWLSCTLGVTGKQEPDDLPDRTSDWCAAVLQAASA
jgi:hypothetical protein